jgi:NCAIR mutase (PurE)-related protein
LKKILSQRYSKNSDFTYKFLSFEHLIKNEMVGIIMGSQSDLPIMQQAADFLKSLEIPYELTVVSAHRTPERMFDYAKTAKGRGLKVIIAGAGGAAHLPGMVASCTTLPVIGVPFYQVTLLTVGIRCCRFCRCLREFLLQQLL